MTILRIAQHVHAIVTHGFTDNAFIRAQPRAGDLHRPGAGATYQLVTVFLEQKYRCCFRIEIIHHLAQGVAQGVLYVQ